MTIKKGFLYILLMAFVASCNNNSPKTELKENIVVNEPKKEEKSLKELKFDDKFDHVCGMPLSAGISDTTSYQNKLYGFCSIECREAFVKEPNLYLTVKK